jgi:hypothetical protein
MLAPLGQAERAATVILRQLDEKRRRDEAARPRGPAQEPKSQRQLDNERVQAMSETEFRAHRRAEVDANRRYPAPGPNPTFHDYRAGHNR